MTSLSEEDRARIAKAISDAEQGTAAEIICVTLRAATEYWATPFLWATGVALIWPWPLISITNLTSTTIWITQLVVFAAVALLLAPRARRLQFTPPWIKRRRARQAAREHFFTQGLHRTVDRSGVLIFVAMAERYAEVLADDGVTAKAGEGELRGLADALRDALSQDRLAAGLLAAIASAGALLAKAAPPRANERNELPDKVIVI